MVLEVGKCKSMALEPAGHQQGVFLLGHNRAEASDGETEQIRQRELVFL
jgi:hypothetical protein